MNSNMRKNDLGGNSFQHTALFQTGQNALRGNQTEKKEREGNKRREAVAWSLSSSPFSFSFQCLFPRFSSFFPSFPQSASGHQARHTSQSLAAQRGARVCVSLRVRVWALFQCCKDCLLTCALNPEFALSPHTHTRYDYHPFPVSQSASSPNSRLLNYLRFTLTPPTHLSFHTPVHAISPSFYVPFFHRLFMSSPSRCKTHTRLLATGVEAVTMATPLTDMA